MSEVPEIPPPPRPPSSRPVSSLVFAPSLVSTVRTLRREEETGGMEVERESEASLDTPSEDIHTPPFLTPPSCPRWRHDLLARRTHQQALATSLRRPQPPLVSRVLPIRPPQLTTRPAMAACPMIVCWQAMRSFAKGRRFPRADPAHQQPLATAPRSCHPRRGLPRCPPSLPTTTTPPPTTITTTPSSIAHPPHPPPHLPQRETMC